jgi:hypothetical protein
LYCLPNQIDDGFERVDQKDVPTDQGFSVCLGKNRHRQPTEKSKHERENRMGISLG